MAFEKCRRVSDEVNTEMRELDRKGTKCGSTCNLELTPKAVIAIGLGNAVVAGMTTFYSAMETGSLDVASRLLKGMEEMLTATESLMGDIATPTDPVHNNNETFGSDLEAALKEAGLDADIVARLKRGERVDPSEVSTSLSPKGKSKTRH